VLTDFDNAEIRFSLGRVEYIMNVSGCTFSFISKEKVPKRKVVAAQFSIEVSDEANVVLPEN
jgi:hypothetical protein